MNSRDVLLFDLLLICGIGVNLRPIKKIAKWKKK